MAGIFAEMVKQALAKGPTGWAQNGEYGGEGSLDRQLGGGSNAAFGASWNGGLASGYGPHVQAAMAAMQAQAMGQGPSAAGYQAAGAMDNNARQVAQAQGAGGLSGFMAAQRGLGSLTQQTANDLAQRRAQEQQQMLQMYSQNLFANQALNDDFANARERAFADMLLSQSTGQLQHQQAMTNSRNQMLGGVASAAGAGIAAWNSNRAQQPAPPQEGAA